jgi:hypothetical protein
MPTLRQRHLVVPIKESTPTFHFFPKLPLELQQDIWQLAAQAEADSTPARIRLIAPDMRNTFSPRQLPVLDANLRYRPKNYYPEIQLRLLHRRHTVPSLFSACRASRDAIKPLYTVWEKQDGGSVYVNEKRDVFYFKYSPGKAFWLLRTIAWMESGPCTEDDQIARLQYMAQLQGCRNLAFNRAMVPRGPQQWVLNWIRTFADMKTMVVVLNGVWEDLLDGSQFVVSSGERVIGEALDVAAGSSLGILSDMKSMTRLYRDNDFDIRVPKVEFVLISNSWREEKWAKDLLVHSI